MYNVEEFVYLARCSGRKEYVGIVDAVPHSAKCIENWVQRGYRVEIWHKELGQEVMRGSEKRRKRRMDRMDRDHIMQFFSYEHLKPEMQEVSKPFCELAEHVHDTLPRNPERTIALRHILQAKDAAVRAFIAK